MAIDMHSHHYGGLVASLRDRTQRPTVSTDAAGRFVLNAMTASTVMSDGYTAIDARMAFLDREGLSRQLVTFPGAHGVDALPVDEALTIVRATNDHLAEICRQSGGRLIGLGGLPLADTTLAAAEMVRVRRELGLLGAILPGNYFMSVAAMEQLHSVLSAANRVRALVMVHPGLMPGELPPAPYADASVLRASALNLQASLSHMVVTVATSGVLDRYPDVAFQVVNLGGTLPFILERIDAIAATRELPALVTVEKLRRMVYDTASLGPRAIELAVKVIGADRMMLGTDYPIFEPVGVRGSVLDAEIPDACKHAILDGTAEAVIKARG